MRKKILPVTLAAILAALGCSSRQDSDQAFFEVSPEYPLVHQSFRIVNTRNVYEINLDVNGSGQVVGIGSDGTAWGYYSTPGMKLMRGRDSRNDVESLDLIVGVRHTDELSKFSDALPGGSEVISSSDWQAYLFPEFKPETQTAITAFENSPNLLGTIVARAVNHDGLWYLVDTTDPSFTGLSDTDGTTTPDYAGRPTLINPNVPVDLQQDVADLGYNFQTRQQVWNTLLNKKPGNLLADPIADPVLPLPNGNVECDLVFSYTINNNPVTVGIIAGNPKSEQDATTIDAFNDMFRNQSLYHNQSILVIPMPTTYWKTFKAWALEDQYHRSNN